MSNDPKAPRIMAVMFTDVVGYTALMQHDVEAARAVRARHRAVVEERIISHGGELFQYLGDGSLSVFPSVVNALHAAVDIQREARTDAKLPLRVGIHQGEITFDAQGPYGDSVNIAARIESLGIAGSVLISGKVHDDIKNQRAFGTVPLGRFELKNVKRPVEVYAVALEGLEVPSSAHVSAAHASADAPAPTPALEPTPRGAAALDVVHVRRPPSPRTGAALAALALATGVAVGLMLPRARPLTVARFDVTPGEGRGLLPNVAGVDVTLSQDGSRIAYVGQAAGGTQLWQRRIQALDAVPIPGTSNARDPVFSPDGNAVAFRVGSSLRTAAFGSGSATTVVEEGLSGGPEWGPDGMLYYPVGDRLFRVAARGGDPEAVTSETGGLVRYPTALPDGRHVLVTIEKPGAPQESRIAAVNLRDQTVRDIGAGVMARYAASGHLVFGTASGTIRAARFDLDRMSITGPAITVLTSRDLRNGPAAKFALSANGTLVYRTGLVDPIVMQFAWVTRSGRATLVDPDWTFNPGRDNRSWDLSPDGTRLVLKAVTDLGEDIWIKPIPTGPMARFTFAQAEERMPRWSPDGETVLFLSARDDNFDVWSRRADGTGEDRLVADLGPSVADVAWSPDGETLLIRTAGAAGLTGGRDMFTLRVGVDSVPVPLLTSSADEASPALSPDGRWLAYNSDETGRREVFIRPFPNAGSGQYQVSSGGGRAPVWSRDGSELFFVADASGENGDARRLMVAAIEPGPPFRVLRTQTLFQIDDNYYLANNTTSYRVAGDDRFLMARYVGQSARIELVLVQNFFEELRLAAN